MTNLNYNGVITGFPSDSVVKNPPANAGIAGDTGSIPRSGRPPGGGNGNQFQYFCLGNPMDRGTWWAAVHGVTKELDMTERLSTITVQAYKNRRQLRIWSPTYLCTPENLTSLWPVPDPRTGSALFIAIPASCTLMFYRSSLVIVQLFLSPANVYVTETFTHFHIQLWFLISNSCV